MEPATTVELDTAPDIAAVEHSEVDALHEPESAITSEPLAMTVEIADLIPVIEHRIDMQEMNQVVDSSSRTEIASDESIGEQPISILVADHTLEPTSNNSRSEPLEAKEVEDSNETYTSLDPSLTEPPPDTFEIHAAPDAVAKIQEPAHNTIVTEQSDVRVAENAVGEHSIASATVETQNTSVVFPEVVDVKTQESTSAAVEPTADEHQLIQSMHLEEKSADIQSVTKENEQTPPLQNAETILHALGLPLPVPHVARSPELSGSKGISGMPRGVVPSRDTRTISNRVRTSVRSRSRDGITLEMAT